MRKLISLPLGMLIFITLGWLAMHSSKIPYNVREIFATNNPYLTLFIFSSLLYWCFGIPVYLALWLITDKWIKIVLFPLLVILHGAVAYGFLRISVPMESIYDIVGTPILNWLWEWELLGRFVALFGMFSLFLTGGAMVVALLQYHNLFFRFIWRWIIVVIILLPIIYWIVIKQASTDNLTELMAGRGSWYSILFLSGWIFTVSCVGSIVIIQIIKGNLWGIFLSILGGVLSILVGYFALHFGTENVIYKYGRFFSAMQFLFSPDRVELVDATNLIFRYIIFHIFMVGLIAITQYPFWTLICEGAESKVNYKNQQTRKK